jgi:hypothetical protein
MATMETRKNTNGYVVLFMALKFLCHFFYLGCGCYCGYYATLAKMCGKGVVKQSAAGGNLIVERMKDKQQST